mmetsp:Transcript_5122/g.13023  ORF Transcript_5122/g.13023 Transcript_5122/m.13023 type:complete len:208 (+) Transcript_5122:1444-2067(+)
MASSIAKYCDVSSRCCRCFCTPSPPPFPPPVAPPLPSSRVGVVVAHPAAPAYTSVDSCPRCSTSRLMSSSFSMTHSTPRRAHSRWVLTHTSPSLPTMASAPREDANSTASRTASSVSQNARRWMAAEEEEPPTPPRRSTALTQWKVDSPVQSLMITMGRMRVRSDDEDDALMSMLSALEVSSSTPAGTGEATPVEGEEEEEEEGEDE